MRTRTIATAEPSATVPASKTTGAARISTSLEMRASPAPGSRPVDSAMESLPIPLPPDRTTLPSWLVTVTWGDTLSTQVSCQDVVNALPTPSVARARRRCAAPSSVGASQAQAQLCAPETGA